jgi:hypothetical protein
MKKENKNKGCLWFREGTEGDNMWWKSGCGHEFVFEDESSPTDNGMKFCPFCGKTLVQTEDSDWEDCDADSSI